MDLLLVVVLVFSCALADGTSAVRSFQVCGNQFCRDGAPFRIVSGSMHYFRIPRAYWAHRLAQMRAGGLNTVQTYVPWNSHQPQKDLFDFGGELDLVEFVKEAQKQDLLVTIRPPPYICGEWELGGFPSWLLAEPGVRLRCSNEVYLNATGVFLDRLLDLLKPLQYSEGGPIVAMQVENEYGGYGNDHAYLEFIRDRIRAHEIDVILLACNGAVDQELRGGAVSGLLKTVNFGSGTDVKYQFDKLREYQPDGPFFSTEYWVGGFDHWGDRHYTLDSKTAGSTLDQILAYQNASVNMYMYVGGTNFGFMNGANYYDESQHRCCSGSYTPGITSYDYDAPISEGGNATEKAYYFRDIIAKYVPVPDIQFQPPPPRKAYGFIDMTAGPALLDKKTLQLLSAPILSPTPQPMEAVGQDYGFILYQTFVEGPLVANVTIAEVHDRALVFLGEEFVGLVNRMYNNNSNIAIDVPKEGALLQILVENMGRVNFGPHIAELKGITQGVHIHVAFAFNWTIWALPLRNISIFDCHFPTTMDDRKQLRNWPVFYSGSLHISDVPMDTFISFDEWEKGVCWVNGIPIGRYWNIGPQHTLFLPAPFLHAGENDIVILELHTPGSAVEFVDSPVLGND